MQLLSCCQVKELIMNFWKRECSNFITVFLQDIWWNEINDFSLTTPVHTFWQDLSSVVISGTHPVNTGSNPN